MTIKIQLAGRTDLDDYFGISGVFSASKLTQTPFLVFITSNELVEVRIVESANKLLQLPDDTPVMGQWAGERRSDFSNFKWGIIVPTLTKRMNFSKPPQM